MRHLRGRHNCAHEGLGLHIPVLLKFVESAPTDHEEQNLS